MVGVINSGDPFNRDERRDLIGGALKIEDFFLASDDVILAGPVPDLMDELDGPSRVFCPRTPLLKKATGSPSVE